MNVDTSMPISRVILLVSVLMTILIVGTGAGVMYLSSTMDAPSRGDLYLEIEADTVAAGAPMKLTPCTSGTSTAVLMLEACRPAYAGDGVVLGTPSGDIRLLMSDGMGTLRMATGAEQRVACPTQTDAPRPVWRLCVARRKP